MNQQFIYAIILIGLFVLIGVLYFLVKKFRKRMSLSSRKKITLETDVIEETPFEKLSEFIEKVDQMKKKDRMDLSSDQDLTIAIMNLVSIEEHFFFSGAKTGKSKYYNLIEEVREVRKSLLQKIIKEYEGEVWCISKHLLAASMRLMECGTKQLSLKNQQEAQEFFQKAYHLYCLFWGLNMKAIDATDLKKIDENALDKRDTEKKGVMKSLGKLVQTVINCCLE